MILLTGATGNIGRPLIDLLVGEGAGVRAVTRDPKAASLPAGVEVVEGDPSRPETITPHLHGVTSLFRIAALHRFQDAFVMNLAALWAALNIKNLDALLTQQSDNGIDQ